LRTRFLICPDASRGEGNAFMVLAQSREAIVERYPVLADYPIYRLSDERPSWLTDARLEGLERNASYTLGPDEPGWLRNIIEHLENGHSFRWYKLAHLSRGTETPAGELGSWVSKAVGTEIRLPGGRPVRVVEIRPMQAPFEAVLVVVDEGEMAAEDVAREA
jgi:hypothetical protein